MTGQWNWTLAGLGATLLFTYLIGDRTPPSILSKFPRDSIQTNSIFKNGITKYEDNTNIFVLGPERSGKTYFMGLACMALRDLHEQVSYPSLVVPNSPLEGVMEDIENNEDPGTTTEPVMYEMTFPATGQLGRESYVKMFGNRQTIRMLDYPGEEIDDQIAFFQELNEIISKQGDNSQAITLQMSNEDEEYEIDLGNDGNIDRNEKLNELQEKINANDIEHSGSKERAKVIAASLMLSDVVLCVIPADEYIKQDDIGDDITLPRESRGERARVKKLQYMRAYEEILRFKSLPDRNFKSINPMKGTDIYLLVTMTDLLEKAGKFNNNDPDWVRQVRREIIVNENLSAWGQYFSYSHFPAEESEESLLDKSLETLGPPGPFIPIYVKSEYVDGQWKPKLDRHNQKLLTKGLESLLTRID